MSDEAHLPTERVTAAYLPGASGTVSVTNAENRATLVDTKDPPPLLDDR